MSHDPLFSSLLTLAAVLAPMAVMAIAAAVWDHLAQEKTP